MENREGQKVPDVVFHTRVDGAFRDVTTDALFAGKTVVLFALPGAFTPTCSATHLPRYNDLADVFRQNGVDDVICLSVNDAFVMEAWGLDQGVQHVRMLPDGNGEFSAGMGMLTDKEALGFGKRSWRYSMLVKDKVIEKMFIEKEQPGDPFEVSDADTMLKYIDSSARPPATISIFTRVGCPYCAKAKSLLSDRKLVFEEIVLHQDVSPKTLRAVSGQSTVPQVFIDGAHIGGSEELEAYFKKQ